MDFGIGEIVWEVTMGFMMLSVWVVPIALILWAVGVGRGPRGGHERDDAPLDVLRRRYASGEISREEFDQVKRTLA